MLNNLYKILIIDCHCMQMYVILGCHLKCKFGLMAIIIISLISDFPTTEFHSIYLIPFNLITNKVSGDIYVF